MRYGYLKFVYFGVFMVGGLAIPVFIVLLTDNDMSVLTRDVFAITRAPPIVGFLSNIGAFVWCSSLSALVLTIFTLHEKGSSKETFLFLYSSALISGWLLLDDFFMIHEFWFLRIFRIAEFYTFTALALAVLSYLVVFVRFILKTQYYLLFTSLAFLFLSMLVDIAGQSALISGMGQWRLLLEDGSKWVGACFWAAYFFSTSRQVVIGDFAGMETADESERRPSHN